MHWLVWLSDDPSGRLIGCQLEGKVLRQAFRLAYALAKGNKSPSIKAMTKAMHSITSSSPPARLLSSFCPFQSFSVFLWCPYSIFLSPSPPPPPSRMMSFDMRRKCGPLTLETQLACTEMSSLFQLLPDGRVSNTQLFISASVGPRANPFSAPWVENHSYPFCFFVL